MNLNDTEYSILKNFAENFIQLDQKAGNELKYEDISSYIDKAIFISSLKPDKECYSQLISDIEYQFKVLHITGCCIFDDYNEPHNWYKDADVTDKYFWVRYKNYLMYKSSIDVKSINLLEDQTLPNIMNCLGNPNDKFDGTRLKRGLIIGDVQSGKTATYSGLICRAADAGYKVVILLAGTTESLRQQTQERIDEAVVGITIKKVGKIVQPAKRVGVGLDNKQLRATSFTSCANDFVGDCDKISTSINAHNSLIIFVVKKNVSILNKLYKWLHDQNVDPIYGYIDTPMLLIDDEADNASVNTRKDETDPTKTNQIIRKICNLFKNATYVGFTATPFANVFIDPDSVDSMKHADLFPEHFIYTLPTPSTYIGAKRIFYEDGDRYGNLRYISDIEEPDYASDEYKDAIENDLESLNMGPFYYKHSKEWHGDFPRSLRESILCYFLANAVRDLRGNISSPRSMLINMSRFVKVQRYIKEWIEEVYNQFVNTIRYDFNDKSEKNKNLVLYKELESLWKKHFGNISDITFERIIKKQTIIAAVEKIQVLVVNSSKSSSKLDYKANPHLRVIAVGGLALSRGLTLEGLLVSYFYRNTATFDVLMQMGRWFGYRPGYEDLFQIWTSQMSARWYEEIAMASENLKNDLKDMYDQHLTPKDFGIKVRDNCAELQITASNKMRTSFNLNLQYSYYGNIYDTPYISLNTAQNSGNLDAIQKFVTMMLDKGYKLQFADRGKFDDKDIDKEIGVSRFFADVPKAFIVELLSHIQCSMVNMNFNVNNILDFVQDENTQNVGLWDVVFEGGDSKENYPIDGLEKIKCVSRYICNDNRRVIQVSSRRRILGLREGKFALEPNELKNAEDACRKAWMNEGLTKSEAEKRSVPLRAYFSYLPKRKPLFIIMLVHPTPVEDGKEEPKNLKKFREELGKDKIVAFAIGFPGVKEAEKAKTYKVNKIYYKLYMQDELESEDTDEDEE
ncbi:Z1 domain-containing protein [Bacteroides intestinalis]|jgi:hypothetical protein|uniref:Z1 domain-containing protein n=1 Tax=Bacteroides intestinalis TaxID=329854 RepID=UPI0022DEADB3|nr:Z1 domain-containing protein [Bacteroides intestinalis]